MIAISRFVVPDEMGGEFQQQAGRVAAVLASTNGFRSVDIGRSVDEPTLWTITTRWADVGSYRRAISSNEVRMALGPLLSLAIDEPSAYEAPDRQEL